MPQEWDWGRVNWANFEEVERDIGEELVAVENALSDLVDDESVSDVLLDAVTHLKSAVVGLGSIVHLHHQHVKELEEG